MSDSLTIVLLLKDRIEYTKRWMTYMNDIYCPYKILIADGGKDKSIESDLTSNKNYQNLNFEYIRYPYDESLEDFWKKYHDVMSRVESKYFIQANNDDFFILDRVSELLKMLEENSDVMGARGGHADFTVYDYRSSKINNIKGSRYTAISRSSPSIEMDSSIERIDFFCRNISQFDFYSNWYCVFRTDAICEIWDRLITLSINNPIVIEMLMHIFILEKGKIKIFNFPYYLRQNGTSQLGDRLVADNDFLERCIIDGALSEFSLSINTYLNHYKEDQRTEIVKSIAQWLQDFIVNVSLNNNRHHNSWFYRLSIIIRRTAFFGIFTERLYAFVFNLSSKQVERKVIKIKEIENYIIK